MRKLPTLSILFISLAFVAPIQAFAATSAGVKPGSFFYFFDTTFENVGLFFTFNPEQKAKKALEHADERLAEAEESASENNPKAVEKAMTGYKEEISLATEKSKGLKDDKRAEELLNIVSESTAKHQEVLKGVLEKVPEEAKEAILKAIEVSKKGQEEATKQIAELKSEVERLKKEVEELKKNSSDPQANEVEKLKKEVEALKKQSVIHPAPKQPTPTTQNSHEQKRLEEKSKIVTLPSGAIVEMDTNGNIIRTIKEALQQAYIVPALTTQTKTSTIQILSVNITPTITSAKIEWQTDKPTESKVFLSGGGPSSKLYNSESGLSTRHSVFVGGLNSNTNYTYEIEVIAEAGFSKKVGSFNTQQQTVSFLKILTTNNEEVFGNNCGAARVSVYTEDQQSRPLPGVNVIFTNPDTGERVMELTTESNESIGRVAVASFSYQPQTRASIKRKQIVRISAGSLEKEVTISLRTTEFEDYPPNNYSDRWIFVDMATTTDPGARAAWLAQRKGYTKNNGWLSKRSEMFFDPDTGMCI